MRLWRLFLAFFRLSNTAICEMSVGRAEWNDFHDYPDGGQSPWHFYTYHCKRCGKRFTI